MDCDALLVTLILLGVLAYLNCWAIIGFYEATLYEEKRVVGTDCQFKDILINKNILWWLRYHGSRLPNFIKKPIFDCRTCMSSLHSTYFYWPAVLATNSDVLVSAALWPIYILILAGITTYVTISMERMVP